MSLVNQPVMSLRLGGQVATAMEPIFNPHNLKILGWWCKVPSSKLPKILLVDDARHIDEHGIAIDDDETLSEPEDLVRHKKILDIRFQLLGKPVKTKRSKLGKVSDYSYNDGMFVQKLYVSRPLVKVLAADDMLIVDRTQIIEITDHYILVRDAEVLAGAKEVSGAVEALPAA